MRYLFLFTLCECLLLCSSCRSQHSASESSLIDSLSTQGYEQFYRQLTTSEISTVDSFGVTGSSVFVDVKVERDSTGQPSHVQVYRRDLVGKTDSRSVSVTSSCVADSSHLSDTKMAQSSRSSAIEKSASTGWTVSTWKILVICIILILLALWLIVLDLKK